MKKIRIHFPAFSIAAEQWIKIHKKIRLLIQKKRKKKRDSHKKEWMWKIISLFRCDGSVWWIMCVAESEEELEAAEKLSLRPKRFFIQRDFPTKRFFPPDFILHIAHIPSTKWNHREKWHNRRGGEARTKHFFSLDNFPSSQRYHRTQLFFPFSSPSYAVNPVFL